MTWFGFFSLLLIVSCGIRPVAGNWKIHMPQGIDK